MISLPQGAPRAAKLTALSIGVALLATACGGSPTPGSTTTAAGAGAGIACELHELLRPPGDEEAGIART